MADEYYCETHHGPFSVYDLNDFDLESGIRLKNGRLAYATFGTLSRAKDNTILFPTFYSGSSKHIQQAYIGEDRVLDPRKYFIIVPNQLGNGLSSSPQNAPPPINAAAFPRVSIGDDVRAQKLLVAEHFGISQLQLVLGGSMGAQQTYEWAVRFPNMVKRAAPIAGTAKCSLYNQHLVQVFKEAITSDPLWDDGWYATPAAVRRGLRRHARVFAASGFSAKLFRNEGWQSLGFVSVEDFMMGFVEAHFLPQDPNNLVLMLDKWQNGDVSRGTAASLQAALSEISAKVDVIAIEEDAFFPLTDIEAEQQMIPKSRLVTISSDWGHLALFGVDPAFNAAIDRCLTALLAS